jgi:hypothetical protein
MSFRTRSFKEVFLALCGEKHVNASLPVTQHCREHLLRIFEAEKIPFDHWELVAAAMRGCWVADCSHVQIRLTPSSWPTTSTTSQSPKKKHQDPNNNNNENEDSKQNNKNPLSVNVFDLPWEKLSVDVERRRPTVLARVACGIVQIVQSSPHLRTLELCGIPFGDDSIVRVCRVFTDASRGPFDAIESVVLANVQLHDTSVAAILQCLNKLPNLSSVSLAGNYITDASGQELIRQFLKLPSACGTSSVQRNRNQSSSSSTNLDSSAGAGRIKHLDLSFNEFSDAFLVQLADAFEQGHGKWLEQLNLNGNHFRVIGHILDILDSPAACPPNLMRLHFSGLAAESLPESIPEGKWKASFDPDTLRLVFVAPKLIQKAKEEEYSRRHPDFTRNGTRTSVLNATTAASRSRKQEQEQEQQQQPVTSRPTSSRKSKKIKKQKEEEEDEHENENEVDEAEEETDQQAILLKKAQDRIKKYQQLLQKGREKEEQHRRGSVANQLPPPEKRRRPSSATLTAVAAEDPKKKKQIQIQEEQRKPTTLKSVVNSKPKSKISAKPASKKQASPRKRAASSSSSSSDVSSFHDSSASPSPVKQQQDEQEQEKIENETQEEEEKSKIYQDEFEEEDSVASESKEKEEPISVTEMIDGENGEKAKASLLKQSEKESKKNNKEKTKKTILPPPKTVPAKKQPLSTTTTSKKSIPLPKPAPKKSTSSSKPQPPPPKPVAKKKTENESSKRNASSSSSSSSMSISSNISSVRAKNENDEESQKNLQEEETEVSPSPSRKKVWKKKTVLVPRKKKQQQSKQIINNEEEEEEDEISPEKENESQQQQQSKVLLLHHIEEMFEEIQTNHDIEMADARQQLLDLHQQLQHQRIGMDEQERRFKRFAEALLDYEDEKSKKKDSKNGKRQIIPLVIQQQHSTRSEKSDDHFDETRRMFAQGIKNLMLQIIGGVKPQLKNNDKPTESKKPTPQELHRLQQTHRQKPKRTASTDKAIGDVNSRLKQLGW